MTITRGTAALLAGAVTGGILLVAPSSAAPSPTSTAPTYHQSASGRTVNVKNGHVIRISLRTATDGGYSWAVVQGKHTSKFKIISRKVVHPAATTGGMPVVGAPSQTVWTLKATARGTATFRAVERRSFDKQDVVKRFSLHVHVTRG